jgi:hypothetical protein
MISALRLVLVSVLAYLPGPEAADCASINEDRSQVSAAELRRMRRVADVMLSAHSRLRDRYRRRSLSLTLLIIALSITAASLAFAAGESSVAILYVHARLSRWVAGLSLVIFFLSMSDLVFDFRVRAFKHDQAAFRLGELKQRLREPRVDGDKVTGAEGIEAAYERTMSLLPAIPDSQFAPLKAKHSYKVALSKAVDTHPGAPVWWLRLLVRYKGLKTGLASSSKASEADDLEMLDRGRE